MASSPSPLSQGDLNLLKNSIINFDCSPLVYQTIIEWGFAKPSEVKIIDHLKNLKIEEKCGIDLNKWMKKNKKILDATDFSNFDVTTLHDLLPVLCCDKIIQTGTEDHKNKLKDRNSIEYLLNEIKKFRNEVSHEYSKAKSDPKIEDKKEKMRLCIRTAGALYNKEENGINVKIATLDAKFDEIVQKTNISYENAVQHVTNKIECECPSFMFDQYSPLFIVPLPGSNKEVKSSQIFETVKISVAVKDKDETNMVEDVTYKDDSKNNKIIFSSSEICKQVTNNFVVINGGPGCGKTTLMRNLFENSVKGSDSSYEGISRFRVPIYIECRTERQNNLRDFLKESILCFDYSKEVIYDAFKKVDGKVFLIDGYDEANDDSRKLVGEIIPFCSKYNGTCIVSGRADAGNNFISKLNEGKLSYNEMFIEPISEMGDKVSLLKKYGDIMSEDFDSVELVKSFLNMNDSAQKIFSCPILLALFISLFLKDKKSLSQLHNQQSVYKAIREIFFEDIKKKLNDSNVPNPKGRTKDLLAVFSYYSLLLFNKVEYFFKVDDYDKLVIDCEKKLSKHVDIQKFLTCILTPETSFKQGKVLTYAFTHSSIQEYLAVEQIIKNMRKCDIDWNSEQHSDDSLRTHFLACLGVSTSLSTVEEEVKRYGNIIKLLMLETQDRKDVANYAKTFTAVLRKYFIPKLSFSRDYILDLISSSNCDSAIISIVSNVLRDESSHSISYASNIRPLTEVLKKKQTFNDFVFNCYESLSDTDYVCLGQLVSVLNDDSKIKLEFHHSYNNYQPLNGEFYSQLKKSRCKVIGFRACVTSNENLSIVRKLWRGDYSDFLYISMSVSASDVIFATLEGLGGTLYLRFKYSEDCPTTDSNPVPEYTNLTITDIPSNGKDIVYRNIKWISPKSKRFRWIELINCHLTDTDTNELMKNLEGEKIKTGWGRKTEVEQMRVNKDKSRNLELFLKMVVLTFYDNFRRRIGSLLEGSFTDAILRVEGEEIPVHKCILAIQSEYFNDMFSKKNGSRQTADQKGVSSSSQAIVPREKANHQPKVQISDGSTQLADTVFEIKNTKVKVMRAVLNYFYRGEYLYDDNVETHLLALELAHQYKLSELEGTLINNLAETINLQNFVDFYNMKMRFKNDQLENSCVSFLKENGEDIAKSENVSKLTRVSLLSLLEEESFAAAEIDIFRAAERWAGVNKPNKDTVIEIVKKIRLATMSQEDLFGVVECSKELPSIDILEPMRSIAKRDAASTNFRQHPMLACFKPNNASIFLVEHQVPDMNVAQSSMGAEVLSGSVTGSALISGSKGCTSHIVGGNPGCIAVKLGKSYRLNAIQILLDSSEGRSYKYHVEVSVDEKDWLKVVDHSKYWCRSHQLLRFDPRAVRFIRMTGTEESLKINSLQALYSNEECSLEDGISVASTNVVIESRGATVTGGVTSGVYKPMNCIDGEEESCAFVRPDSPLIITLGQPYCLSSLRLKLDAWGNCYTIESSTDKESWKKVGGETKGDVGAVWRTIELSRKVVLHLRVTVKKIGPYIGLTLYRFESSASTTADTN